MKALKRKWVTVLLIGALGAISLFPDAGMGAGSTRFMKDLRGEIVLLPPSAPERERLTLVSFVNVISEAEIIGAVALYDDPRTEAATDYMEMYDGTGGLVSVSWFDSHGIRRTAMDFGLLQEEAEGLEGVLVLLLEGEAL